MARLLLAKEVNGELCSALLTRCALLKERGVFPCLATVRVGFSEADVSYERSINKRCENIGIKVKNIVLEERTPTEKVIQEIVNLNMDDEVHGILLFKPLPPQIDERRVSDIIDASKDVDAAGRITAANPYLGRNDGFAPCTAEAVMQILRHYAVRLEGSHAVVLGRSDVIGKPLSMMLLSENATVTICHSKTANLPEICRQADIIIAAVGVPKMLTQEYFSPGQVVIDVGIHVEEDGSMCGDVDFAAADPVVAAITPVPGGVGAVTTTMLAQAVITAASRLTE